MISLLLNKDPKERMWIREWPDLSKRKKRAGVGLIKSDKGVFLMFNVLNEDL